jgi:type II restriction enzyme
MQDIYLGCLLVLTRGHDDVFNAYVLSDQSNIESFMDTFNLWVGNGNQMITHRFRPESIITNEIVNTAERFDSFPDTSIMAQLARDIVNRANGYSNRLISEKCDSIILKWVAAEYELFSNLEERIYREIYTRAFASCSELIEFSNKILNRRKSRAGKSLEHHLSTIFHASDLKFEEQVVTEGNKKPDFIFPDGLSYHNFEFPADKLTMLGAKTTCKDRWRQVLNEADRIKDKHLFTLQKGVSANQLREMKAEHLTLVVPKENLSDFHPDYREGILCLSDFIGMVRERQA